MVKVKQKFSTPLLQLYDINKNFVCNLTNRTLKNSAYSIKRKLVTNDVKTLTFKIPFDNEFIHPNSCEYWIKHEFDWYIIKTIKLSSSDVKVLEVTCEDEFSISKTVLCTPVELVGCTPLEMFNGIMNAIPENLLGYQFKGTDIVDTYRSIVVEDETSCFENLISMAKAFDGILETSTDVYGQKWIFLRKNPHERGKVLRKDYDVSTIDLQYDTSSLFTRLMPFGEQDDDGYEIDISEVNPTGKLYIENYEYFFNMGMSKEEIASNPQCQPLLVKRYENIYDSRELYETAMEDLKKMCVPTVTGNVSLYDLSVLEDSSILEPLIYEKIIITDSKLKMRFNSIIQEIEYDYDNILESNIVLGSEISYSSTFKDLVTAGEKIDRVTTRNPFDGRPTIIASTIRGKINSAVTQIGCMLDTVESPEEAYAILFEDKREGSALYGALAIGTKGILIAHELKEDNTWNWATAINSLGVNASEVVTGNLMADIIKSGILSDIDGTSWIDMENGEFSFANGAMTFNKTDGFQIRLDSLSEIEGLRSEFNDYKKATDLEIADIKKRIDSMSTDFDQYLKDGIIDEVESNAIKRDLATLEKEKLEVDSRYSTVYNNVNLIDPEKSNLKTAYDDFILKYNSLVETINTIIEDNVATVEERTLFNTALKTYYNTIPMLSSAFDEALTRINETVSKTQLNEYNEILQGNIDNVQSNVNILEKTMNESFRDGIIDEVEYIAIKEKINSLESEKVDVQKTYETLYNNIYLDSTLKADFKSAYDIYIASHNDLINYINVTIGDRVATKEEITRINVLLDNYKNALGEYSVKQTQALNNIASVNATEIANNLKEELNNDIIDVSNNIASLESTMNGAFKDGIIDKAEYIAIKEKIDSLETEKEDIDRSYRLLYDNAYLGQEIKTLLKTAYDEYNNSHVGLIKYIDETIGDRVATKEEKNNIDGLLSVYVTKLGNYKVTQTNAINDIANNNASNMTEALKTELNSNIKDVSDKTNALEDRINNYSLDGIFDETEKQSVRGMLKSLSSEKADIDNQFTVIYENTDLTGNYKFNLNSSYTLYNEKYNYLVGFINNLLLKDTISDEDMNSLDTAFDEHDQALALYSTRINEAVDAIATKKKQDATQEAKDYCDAQINVTKEGIFTSVSKTYATKNDLAGISMGMRNRALKTDEAKSYTFTSKQNDVWSPYKVKGDVRNEECIVIFDYTSSLVFGQESSSLRFQSYYENSNNEYVYNPSYLLTNEIKGKESGTISFVVTWGDIKEGTDTWVRFKGDYISGTLEIRNVRVVKGNTFTDWSQAPEDTITYIDDAIASMSDDLKTQIDGKIETWNQTSDPSTNWTAVEKQSHIGDLWYNSQTQLTKRWDGSIWVEQQGAEPLAEEKRRVFTEEPVPPYDKGDLWVTSLEKNGELKTCIRNKLLGEPYSLSDWVSGLKYTDDTLATQIQTDLNNLQIGGRNLWVIKDLVTGYEQNGNIVSNLETQHKTMNTLVELNESRQITIQIWNPNLITNSNNSNRIAFYEADGTYIKSIGSPRLDGSSYKKAIMDVPSGATKMRIGMICGNTSYDESIKIKVELGNKPTDYTVSPEDTEDYTDNLVADLQEQIDGKIETYNQTKDPSADWTTTELRNKHKGDIWYNDNTMMTKRWSGSEWILLHNNEAKEASALAQKKAQVFTVTPTIPYYKGDLWITSTVAKSAVVKTCTTTRTTGSYNSSDWVETLKYTDDSLASKIQNDLANMSIGSKNLILNSNFSNGTANWTGASVNETITYKGSKTCKISCTGATTSKWTGIRQYKLNDRIAEGEIYTIGAMIYVPNKSTLDSSIGLEIKGVKQSDGAHSTIDKVLINPSDIVENKWFKIEKTFTIKNLSNYEDIYYYIWVEKNGTFYVTHCQMCQGNKLSDWSPAPEDTETYTDNLVADLQSQIDGKIETWSQTNDPSVNWTTNDLKNSHLGDLWYNTSTKETKRWNGSAWVLLQNKEAQMASQLASKKAQVFTNTPVVPYYIGDLWVTSKDEGKAVLKTCVATRTSGSYNASDWIEALRYTDDTLANEIKTQLDNMAIGGTNLVRNSDASQGTNYWTNVSVDTSKKILDSNSFKLTRINYNGNTRHRAVSTLNSSIQSNEWVTLSCWVYVDSSIDIVNGTELAIRRFWSNTDYEDLCVIDLCTLEKDKWVYVSRSQKANSTVLRDNHEKPSFMAAIQQNGLIYFSRIKVEKGNMATDWSLAPNDLENYTDNLVGDLQNQIDGKVETWSQNSDPSTNWTTTELKTKHTGDLWYNTSTKETKRWSGSAWILLQNKEAQDASALAQKKARVFTGTPTIPYYKNDLWITSTNEKAGIIKTCVNTRTSGSYTSSDWVETLKYTDDTLVNKVQNDLNNMTIGGRNLLIGSDNNYLSNLEIYSKTDVTYSSDDRWRKMTIATQCTNNEIVQDKWVTLTKTGYYTFSILCKTDATSISTKVSWYTSESGHNTQNATVTSVGNGIYKIVSTYNLTNLNKIRVVDLQNFKTVGASYISFRYPKLEYGNKATDWSPAPEDSETYVDNLVSDLQEQIDGKIETWSQSNDPSTAWTTTELKTKHTGDLWYNTSTKETKRWNGTTWTKLEDIDAKNAETLAKSKRRVFTGTPTTPYDVGDLWVTSLSSNGTIKICKTSRASGNYNSSDWVESLKYTDDTLANQLKNDLNNLAIGGRNILCGTSKAVSQATDKTSGYVTLDPYFTYKKQKLSSFGFKDGDKVTISFDWKIAKNGTNAFTYGDFRIEWIDTNNTFINVIKNPVTTFSATNVSGHAEIVDVLSSNELEAIAIRFRIDNSNLVFTVSNMKLEKGNKATAWTPSIEDTEMYTDNLVADLQEQIDGKIETFSQGTDPSTSWNTNELKTKHKGDIWYNTSTKETKRWNGTAWVLLENKEAQEATMLAQKKAQVFTGTPTVPYYDGDLWITSTNTKAGVIKTCVNTRTSGTYTASDWLETLKYTDDTVANKIQNDLNSMSIGGRNLIKKSNVVNRNSSKATFNEKTNTWSIVADAGNTDTYGVGLMLTGKDILIPYGKAYVLSFELKTPKAISLNIDVNNFPVTGSNWNNNDNDDGGRRKTSTLAISSSQINQWVKCWCVWYNTSSNNTNKVDLYDNSNFGLVTKNETQSFTYYIRNIKGELGNIPTDYSPAPEDTEGYVDNLVADLQDQIDGKIETYSQSNDPSTNWSTAALKTGHTGDLWYNPSTKETKRWNSTAWVLLQNKEAQDASALAQKKAQVFTGTPTIPYYVGDLWITSKTAKSAVVKTCTTTRTSGSYTASDWVETLKYTDDTLANKIQTDLNNLTIGGRNLALNTSNNYSTPYTSFTGATNQCIQISEVLTDGLKIGDKITIRLVYKYNNITAANGQKASCYIQGSGDITSWNDGKFPSSSTLNLSGSGEHEFLYTTTINADHLKNSRWYAQIRHDYVASGSVQFKMFKVEKGNKATDWSPAPEDTTTYTDNLVADLQEQIDGKIETWAQSNDPSSSWTTDGLKAEHKGDIWYNSSTKETKRWSGSSWVLLQNKEAQDASALAQKKARVFTGTPTIPYYVGDLWITSTSSKAGVVKTCITTRTTGNYTASDWVETLKYTDDTLANNIQNQLNNLTIGGRNLFLKSNINQYGLGNWTSNGGTVNVEGTFIDGTKTIKVTGDTGIQYNSYIRLKRNTTYVYSMMIKSSNSMTMADNRPLHMWLSTTETGSQHLEIIISKSGTIPANNWTKAWIVFKTPDAQDVYYMKPFVYGIGSNTVYICNVQVEEGNKATDWKPAPEDTEGYIDNLVYDLQEQIDGKIETYSQEADPSKNWTTNESKTSHKGDIWYNTSTKETKRWNGSSWTTLQNKEAQDASKLAQKKAQVFTGTPTIPYYKGDMWITSTSSKAGVAKICTTTRTSGSYTSSDWIEALKYTDDSYTKKVEANINHRADSIETSVTTLQGDVTKAKSSISVLQNQIVNKVESGNLSSLISQNSESVKIAFNNIAKDIVTISEDGIVIDGIIKSKGADNDTWAMFYPKITNNGDVKFEMYLAGNTAESDFMIYNRYYKNGSLCVDPAASFGKGGATFFNNITFQTFDTGQYAGKCYWQNGTYYPAENNKNLIGLQGHHFCGVYTGWVGSEPGLESSVQLVVSGRELQLRSNFKHSYIQADASGYFRPTSTDSANTWALGSSTYRFSIVYCRTLNQSSDATLKEDIRYILRDDTSKQMMTARVYSNDVINYCDITLTDMYEFVRDDLPLVKFKFKASTVRDEIQPDLFGFIAQDIKDTKIGSILIESGNEGDTLSYDASSYTTVIAGALQEAIIREEKDEKRITQLETKNKELTDRITELENKNTELENKNAELEARLKRLEELILNS